LVDEVTDFYEQNHDENFWDAENSPENPLVTEIFGIKDARTSNEAPRLANGKSGASTPLATTLAKSKQ
jgi:hypothetical protein